MKRLGLVYNFSNFLKNILNEPILACQILKIAFEDGYIEIDHENDLENKDTLILLNLIRKKLIEWS
jgi:hypothetical protein